MVPAEGEADAKALEAARRCQDQVGLGFRVLGFRV